MKILIGYGKTTYFTRKYQDYRILQADNLHELRSSITSTTSPFLSRLPTLINTWFVFDFKHISDLATRNCYLEVHFPPVNKNLITEMQKSMLKHFSGKVVICSIDDKLLQRKNQPVLYHLLTHEVEQPWSDMDYILNLSEKFEDRWISYKWGEHKTINLVQLLQQYLTK